MPTIEQVSKRVFSDRNWLKKCAIGGVLSIIPIVNIITLGYLYELFLQGKNGKEISLPDWSDLRALILNGLRLFVIVLVFACLPLALVGLCASFAFDGFFAKLPLIPIIFMVGPLTCAALYLYLVKSDVADCFNLEALSLMLKGAAPSYTVPTLAFVGICWISWPLLPLAFFGAIFYFHQMGYAYRDLELSRR